MKPLHRDHLFSVPAERAGQAAMAALNGLEKFSPAEQVGGLALVFIAALDRYGTPAADALRLAANLNDEARHLAPIKAVRAYAKGEW